MRGAGRARHAPRRRAAEGALFGGCRSSRERRWASLGGRLPLGPSRGRRVGRVLAFCVLSFCVLIPVVRGGGSRRRLRLRDVPVGVAGSGSGRPQLPPATTARRAGAGLPSKSTQVENRAFGTANTGENKHSLRDTLQVTAERTNHSSTVQGLGSGLAGKQLSCSICANSIKKHSVHSKVRRISRGTLDFLNCT